jgi:hypothetical protein
MDMLEISSLENQSPESLMVDIHYRVSRGEAAPTVKAIEDIQGT